MWIKKLFQKMFSDKIELVETETKSYYIRFNGKPLTESVTTNFEKAKEHYDYICSGDYKNRKDKTILKSSV